MVLAGRQQPGQQTRRQDAGRRGDQPAGDAAEEHEEAEHQERHRVADQVRPAGVQERGGHDARQPVELARLDPEAVELVAAQLVHELQQPEGGQEAEHHQQGAADPRRLDCSVIWVPLRVRATTRLQSAWSGQPSGVRPGRFDRARHPQAAGTPDRSSPQMSSRPDSIRGRVRRLGVCDHCPPVRPSSRRPHPSQDLRPRRPGGRRALPAVLPPARVAGGGVHRVGPGGGDGPAGPAARGAARSRSPGRSARSPTGSAPTRWSSSPTAPMPTAPGPCWVG